MQKRHARHGLDKNQLSVGFTDAGSSIQNLTRRYWRETKDTCFKTCIDITSPSGAALMINSLKNKNADIKLRSYLIERKLPKHIITT